MLRAGCASLFERSTNVDSFYAQRRSSRTRYRHVIKGRVATAAAPAGASERVDVYIDIREFFAIDAARSTEGVQDVVNGRSGRDN